MPSAEGIILQVHPFSADLPLEKTMNEYRHHVSGFFAHRESAKRAFTKLVERGIPRDQLQLFDADSASKAADSKGESDEVLTNVLVDGAIGTAVGTGIGALAQLALVAGSVSLFVASPLVAPLVMIGWGASLGAFIGAAAGVNSTVAQKSGWLADLIHDAIASGQVVLVVQTQSSEETAIAREIVEDAVGEFQDVISQVSI
jgi:hypothetical protein